MNDGATEARLLLRCRGTVQGVGFRPALLRLGRQLGLSGSIQNVVAAVRLDLVGERLSLERFLERLSGALPPAARLESVEVQWLLAQPRAERSTSLAILSDPGCNEPQQLGASWLAPGLRADRAPCRLCWQEFNDPGNRRHRDPFIGCCSCGPRYAISTALPFLRRHTTLATLAICPLCQSEAADPTDRRFHCETISCPACGPQLHWLGPAGTGSPLLQAQQLLRQGGILALQGIAGFQLLVDAANPAAIDRLRERKGRPEQPLALLVTAVDSLVASVRLSPAERRLLKHPAAPIVLLQRQPQSAEHWPGVADQAPGLGVMLPASGLHRLLVEGHGGPLVATSANRHGAPMWITIAEAEAALGTLADGALVHDRAIARPLDDAIAQVIEGRPRLLRRARGHAPEPLRLAAGLPLPADLGPVLALGADLKSAPALACQGRIWLAAPFGSLLAAGNAERFEAAVGDLLRSQPRAQQAIACDAHHGSPSAELALRLNPASLRVAHHQAHGLAVMAEHGLEGPTLLLCADGVGSDPCDPRPIVRGCELLFAPAGAAAIERLGSLHPFALPGGDLACREPRRCALGLLDAIAPDLLAHPGAARVRAAFEPSELALVRRALRSGINSPPCTSLGRLFDGVASLLGLVQRLSFEGQGGLWLEGAAARSVSHNAGNALLEPAAAMTVIEGADGQRLLDWRPWVLCLIEQLAAGEDPARLAAPFQLALAHGLVALVGRSCDQLSARSRSRSGQATRLPRTIALSGGCFQNAALLQTCATLLRRRGLQPYWNEQVPPHDGGLALGQLAAMGRRICSASAAAGAAAAP